MPTDGYAMGNPNPQTIKLVGGCFAVASSRCFPPVLLSCSILRLQLLDPCTSRPETGQRKSESLSQPLGRSLLVHAIRVVISGGSPHVSLSFSKLLNKAICKDIKWSPLCFEQQDR